jgi:hypothetical protein
VSWALARLAAAVTARGQGAVIGDVAAIVPAASD